MRATRLITAAALALSALLAACATTPTPMPVAEAPAPRGDQPSQQAAVVQPRAYCPGEGFEGAARQNLYSLRTLEFSPFGRAERGWEIYWPAIAKEIAADCPPETPAFAKRLAAWQSARDLQPTGAMDAATFAALKGALQGRRPFLKIRGEGLCPDSPDEVQLALLSPNESRWDKPVRLRPGALAAYRAMVAAAKREAPQAFVAADTMKIFSAHRSPVSDDARCATEGNCNGLVRAACSAHRTGLAMDLNVGFAPGSRADTSEDSNRLYQSRTAIYRWMIANAGRFGFVNYPFEPWHWEWTGELMTASQPWPPRRPAAPSEPGEGTPGGSGQTYAQSSPAGLRPPPPSSPEDPDRPGW